MAIILRATGTGWKVLHENYSPLERDDLWLSDTQLEAIRADFETCKVAHMTAAESEAQAELEA